MVTADIWPALDYSRVPYSLYHDTEVYAAEQERIFRGPTWNFLALDVEIPNPGDFRATYVGETPVIVNRDENGEIRQKRGDTLIKTLRKTYGPDFAAEMRSDARLDTLRERSGGESLSKLVKDSHRDGSGR